MTFTQIYQRVQQQVSDTSAATLSNLKNYINDGQQDFASRRDFWSWLYGTDTAISATAGTDIYSLSSTAHKIISLRDTTNETYLQEVNLKQFRLAHPNVDTTNDRGKPTQWYFLGVDSSNNLKVGVYPVPDGSYTIIPDIYKRVTDLSADSDNSVIPARYHKALVYYACARFFELKQDPMATYYNQMYENEIEKALVDQFNETDGMVSMQSERVSRASAHTAPDNYFLEI